MFPSSSVNPADLFNNPGQYNMVYCKKGSVNESTWVILSFKESNKDILKTETVETCLNGISEFTMHTTHRLVSESVWFE